jgi:hypothetical protein
MARPGSKRVQTSTINWDLKIYPEAPLQKVCSACEKVRDRLHFAKWKRSQDGLQPWCLDCKANRMRSYRKANRRNVEQH